MMEVFIPQGLSDNGRYFYMNSGKFKNKQIVR